MPDKNFYIKLKKGFEESSRQFKNISSELGEQQLSLKLDPKKWNVGQIFEHIINSNASFFPIFDTKLQNPYNSSFWEKLPLLPGLFGSLIKSTVNPLKPKAVKTFPVFEPKKEIHSLSVLEEYKTNINKLNSYVNHFEGLKNQSIVIHSPASSLITYSLRDCLEFLQMHEAKHLGQIKEILSN